MSYSVEKLLENVPEEDVLYSISPPAAKKFGILPVGVKKQGGSVVPILEVVGLEGRNDIDGALGWQMFRKVINYLGRVDRATWDEAYQRFYSSLLK